MTAAMFDKQDQYDKVAAGALPGERIFFVYDAIGAGTGFIGVTSLRVVLQDNSFIGKKIALTSIPYSRVNAVSYVSDKSMFGKFASTSQIAISAGGATYEVQFRGEEKAKAVHDGVLSHMLGVAAPTPPLPGAGI
jgi:hypothetical protein